MVSFMLITSKTGFVHLNDYVKDNCLDVYKNPVLLFVDEWEFGL